MNIVIDDAIFQLQSHGGISTIWHELTARLPESMPDCTFDATRPADVFVSTYYQPAPAGAKSVVMAYDFIHERYPGFPPMMPDSVWKQAAIREADAVIAISQWTADDVQAFTGKRASVAYPATSLERASHEAVQAFKEKYRLPDTYVLIVGRRDLYKNVNTYYQALGLMLPHLPYTLAIGGERVARLYIHGSQAGLQIDLPPDELPAAYTGALCLVYPSLYEGFGLPVLEAYACGCPVICGNGGALAEICSAALVVDVTKPRAIAEALVKMSDPGQRIDHILRGYDVAKRFSWQRMTERVAAVIQEAVERETA